MEEEEKEEEIGARRGRRQRTEKREIMCEHMHRAK